MKSKQSLLSTILSLALALSLCLGLTACGDKGGDDAAYTVGISAGAA